MLGRDTLGDPETGTPGRRRPAVIAAVQDAAGSITGIQRIFVDPHRPGWPFKPLRLSLGRIKGSALRPGPVRDTIMLAASVEDGLALSQMFVGASVWCAIGDDNLTNVIFPPPVKTVVIAGDGDEQGRAAVERARAVHEATSLNVQLLFPTTKDFNGDWLMIHS